MYDYLVVGAGLFGSVFAYEAQKRGMKCLVVDKKDHIGGTCYTRREGGIRVHEYGAHIFRTNDKTIWEYVNQFAEFNRFTNCPVAMYKGEMYNLPFNMNTFYKIYGVTSPDAAKAEIQKDCISIEKPKNLEEYCISTIGRKLYEILVKGYTQKQWNKPCAELPPDIMPLPIRFTFDNNYFNERYQGIPIGGYTQMFEKMLSGSTVETGCDFFAHRQELECIAKRVVFTGKIDDYYGCCYGPLEYRSLRFEHITLPCENAYGNAVTNFTDAEVPYTRIIEHKHFEGTPSTHTIVTKEFPVTYDGVNEPFYPIITPDNIVRYKRYKALSDEEPKVLFGGRLGTYSFDNMDKCIKGALDCARKELGDSYE